MKRPNSKQWIAIAALALVLLLTGLFAVRTVRRAVYWRMHRDEVIRPWMTLPYVAHSYRVPPRVLYDALNIQHPPHDRRPIRKLAQEQNRSVEEVIRTLDETIARTRQQPPPNGPPPETSP
ncbi:MAG TPA: hypothetical protein VE961_11490 [Pyrinomonadaceae bacterium]|nr:hypothetical protein [Pyrinomonadaceae bacterium]